MKTVGIICEYNPFHLGHQHQIQMIRQKYGEECGIVCLMSGNYVQRGAPAILDKELRARSAIRCGANLVLELPIPICLSSAEGYAAGGVEIADGLCDVLSFGAESMDADALFRAAEALNSEGFSLALRDALSSGISFPAARQKALERICPETGIPVQPNDILATEYCKAILRRESNMEIFPLERKSSYHAETWTDAFPSATAVRNAMLSGEDWLSAVPSCIHSLLQGAVPHHISWGERAILYRLRTMSEEEFAALPYGSEGLWRRFYHACKSGADLNEIIENTKTKRYTRTRIDRMILCAFLGITKEMLHTAAPYVRILAFDDIGRAVLREKESRLPLLNAGVKSDLPCWELEQRCSDLYGLFAGDTEKPGREPLRRVCYDRRSE